MTLSTNELSKFQGKYVKLYVGNGFVFDGIMESIDDQGITLLKGDKGLLWCSSKDIFAIWDVKAQRF